MSSNAHTVTKGGSTLAKHLYIIDTCVLLHDPLAIYKFAENDIYIPLAVIDDLDDIKTRKDNVAWSARETFRQLENFTLTDLLFCVFATLFLPFRAFKLFSILF